MRVRVNGIEVEYSITGSGPWFVLIHGLGKDLRMWDPMLPELSKRYCVVTYDLRGWGKSDKPAGPYSFQHWADDLLALLHSLGIRKAYLMGWSLGGYIIQQFIGQNQDIAEAIIFASTISYRPAEAGQAMLQRADLVEREGMRAIADAQIERWWSEEFRKAHPEAATVARQILLETDPKAFAATARTIAQFDFTEQIRHINVPTEIIIGSLDQGTPVSAAKAMRDNIPGAQLRIVEGALHDIITEQPQGVASLVLGFLDSLQDRM